ncbi:hypothetical protein PM082_007107 [Marasmius tenuissimus]|nr:hypothetical protein PM082_007107 [Marasmius tenuissimus]
MAQSRSVDPYRARYGSPWPIPGILGVLLLRRLPDVIATTRMPSLAQYYASNVVEVYGGLGPSCSLLSLHPFSPYENHVEAQPCAICLYAIAFSLPSHKF